MTAMRANRRKLQHLGKALLTIALLSLAAFLLHRTFRVYDAREILASITAISPARLAAVAGFALASYVCLTGFDALAVRYAGGAIPYRRVAVVSMTSLSIGHSIGFAALSSGAIRYRFYSRYGLSVEQVAKVILLCAATVALGLSTALSIGFLARPAIAERIGDFAPSTILGLGILAGLVPIAYLTAAAVARGNVQLGSWSLKMPSFRTALGQAIIGPLNLAFVVACLHTALSARSSIDYLDVLAVYAIANGAGLLTHVPGGLGVIEAVVAALLPGADVVGALIVFRVVYFLIPFMLGTAGFVVAELSRRRHPPDQKTVVGDGLLRVRR
jgi:uncharacterized membrane protein YbhN (UPF0104 family)